MAIVGYPAAIDTLKLTRGDPLDVTLSMLDGNGDTVDLLGFGTGFYAQLRYSHVSSDADADDFDVDVSTGLVDGVLTYIVLSLSAAQSAALAPVTSCQPGQSPHLYVFDVEARGGTVTPWTIWEGTIEVLPDVTRA